MDIEKTGPGVHPGVHPRCTPRCTPVPLYNREIGVFSTPGALGPRGPKYPIFLYYTVVEGSQGVSRGAPQMHPQMHPSTTVQ